MATFVLVHGAWHGAWCWYKVVAGLRARGHYVLAPDLPGHGMNRSSTSLPTCRAYVACLVDLLGTLATPAVLVGHSMAGIVITGAAEIAPERVRRLVYLSAFLCENGKPITRTAGGGRASPLFDHLDAAPDGASCTLSPESMRSMLYHDCPEEDVALAQMMLTAQAVEPLSAPVAWTTQRFGAVPRAYIECLDDNAIGLQAQRIMTAKTPCDPIIPLASSHSPFFSMPRELVTVLHHLAQI